MKKLISLFAVVFTIGIFSAQQNGYDAGYVQGYKWIKGEFPNHVPPNPNQSTFDFSLDARFDRDAIDYASNGFRQGEKDAREELITEGKNNSENARRTRETKSNQLPVLYPVL
jgi:hypothetical protein